METINSNTAVSAQAPDGLPSRPTTDKLRRDCYDALVFVDRLSAADASALVDSIFEIVISVLRRQYGIGYNDAELMLANARRDAEDFLGGHIDGLVNVHSTIEAITEYLADGAVT